MESIYKEAASRGAAAKEERLRKVALKRAARAPGFYVPDQEYRETLVHGYEPPDVCCAARARGSREPGAGDPGAP